MPRRHRSVVPGGIYHVTFRGVARCKIFLDEADYRRFIKKLEDRVRRFVVRLFHYCLMSNHGHLLVETPQANLPAFMQSLLTSYSLTFNRRHLRAGHLTQGRYDARVVEGDQYLLGLTRYVHLNPICGRGWRRRPTPERLEYLERYRWSSHRAYAGLAEPESFVEYGPILSFFGGDAKTAQAAYREYVERAVLEDDQDFARLMKASPVAIGSPEFMEAMEEEARVRDPEGGFRKRLELLEAKTVLDAVAVYYEVSPEFIRIGPRGHPIRLVAADLLKRLSGMRQSEIARLLGMKSRAAVSMMFGRMSREDHGNLAGDIERLERLLEWGV